MTELTMVYAPLWLLVSMGVFVFMFGAVLGRVSGR
jgi:hypothetical protein